MSRPRKKPVVEEPAVAEPVVDEPKEVEPIVVETAAPTSSTIVEGKENILAYVRQNLIEHSRRRPGSVSGMLPPVYRLVLPGGRARFFTLPINVEEGAIEDGWKQCKAFMSSEEYVAFVVSVVEVPRPAFYSSFRVITLD